MDGQAEEGEDSQANLWIYSEGVVGCPVEPLRKGHLGEALYVLCKVQKTECIGTIKTVFLGPQVVFFIERSIILCPYLGESTVGGPLYIIHDCFACLCDALGS